MASTAHSPTFGAIRHLGISIEALTFASDSIQAKFIEYLSQNFPKLETITIFLNLFCTCDGIPLIDRRETPTLIIFQEVVPLCLSKMSQLFLAGGIPVPRQPKVEVSSYLERPRYQEGVVGSSTFLAFRSLHFKNRRNRFITRRIAFQLSLNEDILTLGLGDARIWGSFVGRSIKTTGSMIMDSLTHVCWIFTQLQSLASLALFDSFFLPYQHP